MTLCNWCDERFDDFVDGQLCEDDHALFLRHVEFCDACKLAVDTHSTFMKSAHEWQKTADLRHAESFQMTSSCVRQTIRSKQLFVVVQSTAALLFVGVVSWVSFFTPEKNSSTTELPSSEDVAGQVKSIPTNEDAPKAQVQIVDSKYVAVPLENKNPNITIYWLHPTFESSNDEPPADSSSLEQHETLFASNSL